MDCAFNQGLSTRISSYVWIPFIASEYNCVHYINLNSFYETKEPKLLAVYLQYIISAHIFILRDENNSESGSLHA